MGKFKECPKCKVSLDGGSIWQTFMTRTGDEAEADRIAAQYGATRLDGRWGREIGLVRLGADRTFAYKCPDCGHEWPA